MTCFAYIFTGGYDEAYQMVPNDFSRCGKFDEHTIRLVFAIILYHRGEDLQSAFELDALRKAIRNDETSYLHYRDLIALLQKFFQRVAGQPDSNRRRKAVMTLKGEAKRLSGEYFLFRKWLLNELETESGTVVLKPLVQ